MKRKMRKVKLFLAASEGGHLTEGLALFKNLPDTELYIFSEDGPRLSALSSKHYGYRHINHPFLTLIAAFLKVFWLILWIRPDWVVTTGAECGTAAVIAAKLLFRRTIVVETASRFRTKTMSAKICYPLVDHFFVQWEESLPLYGEKAKYIGGIL